MKNGYDSIQQTDGGDSDSDRNKFLWLKYLVVAAVVITAGEVFLPAPFIKRNDKSGESFEKEHWPPYLSSRANQFTKRPVNTDEATSMGWKKNDEKCNPNLGEPWLFGGKRSYNSSVTLYFTPAVGEIPGVVSAVEVDYYGYIETSLIGTYFTKERTSDDGPYHSVSVAFQNGALKNLCDASTTIEPHGEKYLAISPDLKNRTIPTEDSFSIMSSNGWKPGSCIPQMGYHWISDVEGGADLSYKAESTVPVVPMYYEGKLTAFFFLATTLKQNWPASCTRKFPFLKTPEEHANFNDCMKFQNYWDPNYGLLQETTGPFFVCSNVCDRNCKFTGARYDPPTYSTMHWFVRDKEYMTDKVGCKGKGRKKPYCPDGNYPLLSPE